MTDVKIYAAIAVSALVTAALRFLPFLLFGDRPIPRWLDKLGRLLPYAVMGMLVVYCLKDVSFAALAGWLPALIASAVTVGSYVWKKNTLASILAGTACYMILVQAVFPL